MFIRKATITDADAIAQLLLTAMETIVYEFLGVKNHNQALAFLQHFTAQSNNQYSYQNCYVVENKNRVIAAINCYDGALLESLRHPIHQYITTHYNMYFNPEDETEAGEIYIDSFAVLKSEQGKGVGAMLLKFIIQNYVYKQHKTLGLLVEEHNLKAEHLYLNLGFKMVGTRNLVGKTLKHLQYTA
ncbi:N-acetyltransferase GCN5 [Formosa agariphila KMM 3901]|uniref:N-acetyltransferase GCN5 n=1 Tax=Formosa agariphila (strain DSM 15362 / KCTC 12365 / LMG 23005 / KMM 3901 / M-2Alg 35-1) TaxID=1347342 RepID=T2KJE8_FORAG|nr:GNAT family N-acetyltransferase [Formosa agariphila]CDF78895.1 N-acetyltransferase GCN5 [Formosa agariphila KMM 3901]